MPMIASNHGARDMQAQRFNHAPCIYILAPVHNRRDITVRFCHCLLAQTYDNWHLVLIDDGSTDGTSEMVRDLIPSATILRGTGNWWWAGSLDRGYRWLQGQSTGADDIVLIMNDDTEFDPTFLQAAVSALPRNSLLLSQLYDLANGEFCEAGVRFEWRRLACWGENDPARINCFSTRGLFLRVDDMKKIGGFYPRMLPHYLSDYEYTMRAHRKGYSLATSPEVFIRYDATSTGIRELKPAPLREVIRTALSARATDNPIYWSSFVLLACPLRYIPRNLLLVWQRFAANVASCVRRYNARAG
jgi:GT2 family glycosyltransferase